MRDRGPARPWLIGHRGAAGLAPENTLAGFRAAKAAGVGWVEFDVRLSRDNHLVLFHDDTLNRTTDSRGAVCERDLADLKQLDAGAWFGARFAGERIPTLAEAIDALAAMGLGANVEIKPDTGREAETGAAVAEALTGRWPDALPSPIVSSFRPAALAAARAAAPDLPYALLVETIPDDWPDQLRRSGCQAVHADARRLVRGKARAVIAAGVPLRCYTVNAPGRARALRAMGVSAVFTDRPDRLAGT